MKTIGAFAAETVANAPPDLTLPSIFVNMIDPISTAALNALAYDPTAYPTDASTTKIRSVGSETESISLISYKSSSDY